jgi:hypothetical protein
MHMRVFRAALLAVPLLAWSTYPASAATQPLDDDTWTTVTVAAARPAEHRQAPADEYFGPNRLSNLGVRNAIRDMNLEGTSPLALPIQLDRIAAVQAALALWSDKYPNDSWVPGTTLDFAKFLQSKQQAFTDDLAAGYLIYLQAFYPASRAGFEAHELLARSHPIPGFDMGTALPADPIPRVGDSLYPKLKSR